MISASLGLLIRPGMEKQWSQGQSLAHSYFYQWASRKFLPFTLLCTNSTLSLGLEALSSDKHRVVTNTAHLCLDGSWLTTICRTSHCASAALQVPKKRGCRAVPVLNGDSHWACVVKDSLTTCVNALGNSSLWIFYTLLLVFESISPHKVRRTQTAKKARSLPPWKRKALSCSCLNSPAGGIDAAQESMQLPKQRCLQLV